MSKGFINKIQNDKAQLSESGLGLGLAAASGSDGHIDLAAIFGAENVVEIARSTRYVLSEKPKSSPQASETPESSSQTDPDPNQKK